MMRGKELSWLQLLCFLPRSRATAARPPLTSCARVRPDPWGRPRCTKPALTTERRAAQRPSHLVVSVGGHRNSHCKDGDAGRPRAGQPPVDADRREAPGRGRVLQDRHVFDRLRVVEVFGVVVGERERGEGCEEGCDGTERKKREARQRASAADLKGCLLRGAAALLLTFMPCRLMRCVECSGEESL